MIGIRASVAAFLLLWFSAPGLAGDGGSIFSRKPRVDPARVRQLTETLRSDPDEKRRQAAVAELTQADPLVHQDVIPALIAAMRRDVASVRTAAAEAVGRFKMVFPLAGSALEATAESDPALAVRTAARQSLWEYHLNGYRSTKGVDAFAAQTVEPPIAKPARTRLPVTMEPPTAAVVTTSARLPVLSAMVTPLPAFGPPPGPRVDVLPRFFNLRPSATRSLHPNLTVEPPVARTPIVWLPPQTPLTPSTEPPIIPRYPDPVVVVKAPALARDLPPIVTPP